MAAPIVTDAFIFRGGAIGNDVDLAQFLAQPLAAGDTVIVTCVRLRASGGGACTAVMNNGNPLGNNYQWTIVTDGTNVQASSDNMWAAFSKTLQAGDFEVTNGFHIAFSGGWNGTRITAIGVIVLRHVFNADVAWTVANVAGSTGNSVNPDSPSLTPGWASTHNRAFTFMLLQRGDRTITTWPSSYTDTQFYDAGNPSANNGSGLGFASRAYVGTTEDPGAWTMNQQGLYSTLTCILRGMTPITPSVPADQGSYTLTGIANFWRRSMFHATGAYTYTGVAALFNALISLPAAAGAYTLTGIANLFSWALKVVANAGSYTLTGSDVIFDKGVRLLAEVGTYTLTGIAAGFSAIVSLLAAAGAYAYTGQAVLLVFLKTLVAEAGVYVYAGVGQSLVRGVRTFLYNIARRAQPMLQKARAVAPSLFKRRSVKPTLMKSRAKAPELGD